MDATYDNDEELSEEAIQRIKLIRLIAALASPAVTVKTEAEPSAAIDSALTELDAFAHGQLKTIKTDDDLADYESALAEKVNEITRRLHPDIEDRVLQVIASAIETAAPVRATINRNLGRPMVEIDIYFRLHGRAEYWLSQAPQQPRIEQFPTIPLQETLRTLLEATRLKVAILAKKSGVNKATIHRWLKGESETPRENHLNWVAQVFAKQLGIEISGIDLMDAKLITRLRDSLSGQQQKV